MIHSNVLIYNINQYQVYVYTDWNQDENNMVQELVITLHWRTPKTIELENVSRFKK